MSHRVLETDFPLMAPPNPPLAAHHRLLPPGEAGGRNGSLRAAYSCEEELLPRARPPGRRPEELLPSSSGCSSEASCSLPSTGQPSLYRPPRSRHRKPEAEGMSGGGRCCFGLLTLVAQVLLHGVLALTLYWVIQYRWPKDESGQQTGLPFAWRHADSLPEDRDKQWNLHPVLMVAGLIYCSGQAMLVYRSCRCCRRIWNKLLHTMFHLLAVPCTVLGFLAAFDYHQQREKDGQPDPIPHFYSIHSWLGLATMATYAMQFVVGIFSFLILLCCESATAGCRAALVPLHSTMGTSTFLLAIATCVAGLTEKAFFELSSEPTFPGSGAGQAPATHPALEQLGEEAIFRNTIAAILAALGLLLPAILACPAFRAGLPTEGRSQHDGGI